MRSLPSAVLTLLAKRTGHAVRNAVWIVARNYSTGAPEPLGFWDGEYDLTLTVNGAPRTYVRANSVFTVPTITTQVGIEQRVLRIPIAGISDALVTAVRAYDARLAPIEVHRLVFDPVTGAQLGFWRAFKGVVDQVTLPRGAVGGESEGEIAAVSSARALSRVLPFKKSDATQARRSGDRFRRYVAISGEVNVKWERD